MWKNVYLIKWSFNSQLNCVTLYHLPCVVLCDWLIALLRILFLHNALSSNCFILDSITSSFLNLLQGCWKQKSLKSTFIWGLNHWTVSYYNETLASVVWMQLHLGLISASKLRLKTITRFQMWYAESLYFWANAALKSYLALI